MTIVRTFPIPGLATVTLDTRVNQRPALEIRLAPEYRGDLNDIALETPGPDDVYLSCDHASAINNPELKKFMEVMTHWDHDYDGKFDCDEIIDAIEEALWQSRDTPDEFHRPDGGLYTRAVMSIMPPAPERHIVLSFGRLQPRFRWFHYAAAIPMLIMVAGLITLQNELVPFMKYSVVSGFLALMEYFGLAWWLTLIVFFVAAMLIGRFKKPGKSSSSLSPHTYGFFNKASVFEEQAFREGSENWTLFQRVRSCLAFGAIHMINLIYPLSTILPLAIGGGLFMIVYLYSYRQSRFRRTAVLDAAVWHRVYNKVALTALAITLLAYFGLQALGLFAAFALLLALGTIYDRRMLRREKTAVDSKTSKVTAR